MIIARRGELGAEPGFAEKVLGVEPGYIKKKLDGIEFLLYLAAGGAMAAAAMSFLLTTRSSRS